MMTDRERSEHQKQDEADSHAVPSTTAAEPGTPAPTPADTGDGLGHRLRDMARPVEKAPGPAIDTGVTSLSPVPATFASEYAAGRTHVDSKAETDNTPRMHDDVAGGMSGHPGERTRHAAPERRRSPGRWIGAGLALGLAALFFKTRRGVR